MTKIRTAAVVVTVAFVAAAALSSPASARKGRGFLADIGVITGIITPDQADVLDQANDALGNPVDQAADTVLDQVFGDEDD